MDKQSLNRCTVRIEKEGEHLGTGFFIEGNYILTCYHVVEGFSDSDFYFFIKYKDYDKSIRAKITKYDEELDIALLTFDNEQVQDHPIALLKSIDMELHDDLYTFGYTRSYREGEASTFYYEGSSYDDNKNPLLKLKGGQAGKGLSGAPVLHVKSGSVRGIMRLSRDLYSDLGARIIPIESVCKTFNEVKECKMEDKGGESSNNHDFSRVKLTVEIKDFIIDAFSDEDMFDRLCLETDIKNIFGSSGFDMRITAFIRKLEGTYPDAMERLYNALVKLKPPFRSTIDDLFF